MPIHLLESTQTKATIDLSVIIAFAALVLAAISPAITGHYRLKEKKLDAEMEAQRHHITFVEEHKAIVIENYIKATSAQIAAETTEIETDYISAMGEVLLYVDTPLWYLVEKIDQEISNLDVDAAKADLIILCKQLSGDNIRK